MTQFVPDRAEISDIERNHCCNDHLAVHYVVLFLLSWSREVTGPVAGLKGRFNPEHFFFFCVSTLKLGNE